MSAYSLLPFIGWTFLPNLVTGWIQKIWYTFITRAGDPKPQPGSAKYIKHRRRIQITVIIVYLLYTVYEADHHLLKAGDFYQSLGVPFDVEDRGIKSRFRRLAASHHPDKVTRDQDREASEAFFLSLRLAQETLTNPTKRFAYDRFGPDALTWQHCSSVRDFLMMGLQTNGPLYLGFGIMMIILSMTSYLQWGRFWRYLISAALVTLEIYAVTRPYFPPILTRAINPVLSLTSHPPLLPFQFLALARQATLALFVALSQLGPLLQPPAPTTPSASNGSVDISQIARLEQFAQANEVEATRLLGLDMAPFSGDEQNLKYMRVKVKEWLVQNTIRNDPEVRDVIGKMIGKRRLGAPAGAKI